MAEEQVITFIAKGGERVKILATSLEIHSKVFSEMMDDTKIRDSFEIQTNYSHDILIKVRNIMKGDILNIKLSDFPELNRFNEQYELYSISIWSSIVFASILIGY